MESYRLGTLTITIEKEGAREFTKVSYPIRYGLYSEIRARDYTFQYDLNGEIKYIQGRTESWPHPAEWLKRTAGNDWVYYSSGDYRGTYELFGEYYFPCLSYGSNAIAGDDPFDYEAVRAAIRFWSQLPREMEPFLSRGVPDKVRDILLLLRAKDEQTLAGRARKLHALTGGRITVLPPDARHVDYEVIPVIIADGCMYNCGFCMVKSGLDFTPRTRRAVMEQLENLKRYYGRNIRNYNSLFLGQHDALGAGRELIEFTAETAYELFQFENSYVRGPRLFLFGSADSLLKAGDALYRSLNGMPFFTYINVGLESADAKTLAALKKPLAVEKVREAFSRMLDINRHYANIEVTANFVLGETFPGGHLASFLDLARDQPDLLFGKGTIYLSPLVNKRSETRGVRQVLLKEFSEFKMQSRLPAYLYLIQRL